MGTSQTQKRSSLRRWQVIAGVSLLSVLLLPLLLLISISDDQTIVTHAEAPAPRDAQRVKRVYRQLELAAYFNRPMKIFISEEDINSFFKLATRGISRLQGRINISAKSGAMINTSLHLPENPFGDYINLSISLPASGTSIKPDSITVGNVTLTGKTAWWLVRGVSNHLLGEQQSETLFGSIKRLKAYNKGLVVHYQPIQNLGEQLSNLAKLSTLFGDYTGTAVSSERIRFYYSELCQQLGRETSASLNGYLQQAIALAAQNSDSSTSAADENRAALYASAILFGSYRFNTIFQAVPKQQLRDCQNKVPTTTLAGRRDLSLHFIYAAAIKILSDSQLSFAMSEFKELSDALSGGSGFSFADLAADHAGIRFAELAGADRSASYLQHQAAGLSKESFFFPDIQGLPEGITQSQFESEFEDLEADNYQQALTKIKQRINSLPLYKNAP